MADQLLQSFRALPTKGQRLEALQKLVMALDSDERAAVSTTIAEMSDPLARLPYEIVLRIFNFLPVLNVWTLQSVCKRWRRTLSSATSLQDALTRWKTHHAVDDGRSEELSTEDSIVSKVEHVKALRLGSPFQIATFQHHFCMSYGGFFALSYHEIDLKGSWMAYYHFKPQGVGVAVIRNLTTGESRMFYGEARERLMAVFLTGTLAVYLSFDGHLYILPLSDILKQPKRIKLPSASVVAYGGDSNTIVLAISEMQRLITGQKLELLVYDAKKDQLRSLTVTTGLDSHDFRHGTRSRRIIVDSLRSTADMFFLEPSYCTETHKALVKMVHMRVSLDGTVLGTFTTKEAAYDGVVNNYFDVHDIMMYSPVPTGYHDQFRLPVYKVSVSTKPQRLVCAWLFDAQEAALTLEDKNLCGEDLDHDNRQRGMSTLWKGNFLKSANLEDPWMERASFINETFMVSLEVKAVKMTESRIRAFCFDRNVQLADGYSSGLWEVEHEVEDAGAENV